MSTPKKASIVNLTQGGGITCHFNPKDLKLTKKVSWKPKDAQGKNMGVLEFSGGSPAQITLELLFDTTESGGDVRTDTNKLLEMTLIEKGKIDAETNLGEPPRVRFIWGTILSFEAVITNVSLTYKMFRGDGTPVRATANVTFQQSKDDASFLPQNPTSRSHARRVWVVVEGQTLSWIAYKEYGDPNHWRHIANTNGITNPMALRAGQVLNIVPLA